jgi:hypothetical protein
LLAEALSRCSVCSGRRVGSARLIPVMVTAEQDAVATQPSRIGETIEIDLGGNCRIRVGTAVDAQARR